MASRQPVFDFAGLVTSIQEADVRLAAQAIRAVNLGLTLRNWVIGFYIAEFELRGADRSAYGDRLLTELSKALSARRISNTGRRQLYQYLSFYRAYPQILRTLPAQFRRLLPGLSPSRKVRTASAPFALAPDKLFGSLSYSHFELLVGLDNSLARAYYEAECVRGHWSVRELKRQIGTLCFERSGLSRNKKKLAALIRSGAEQDAARLAVRDPYIPIYDLTLTETFALVMAVRQLSATGDFILTFDALNAIRKIASNSPQDQREFLRSCLDDVVLKEGFGCDSKVLADIQKAVKESRGISIVYDLYSEGGLKEYMLDPCQLYFKRRNAC